MVGGRERQIKTDPNANPKRFPKLDYRWYGWRSSEYIQFWSALLARKPSQFEKIIIVHEFRKKKIDNPSEKKKYSKNIAVIDRYPMFVRPRIKQPSRSKTVRNVFVIFRRVYLVFGRAYFRRIQLSPRRTGTDDNIPSSTRLGNVITNDALDSSFLNKPRARLSAYVSSTIMSSSRA